VAGAQFFGAWAAPYFLPRWFAQRGGRLGFCEKQIGPIGGVLHKSKWVPAEISVKAR
jgi:hypothetical protein